MTHWEHFGAKASCHRFLSLVGSNERLRHDAAERRAGACDGELPDRKLELAVGQQRLGICELDDGAEPRLEARVGLRLIGLVAFWRDERLLAEPLRQRGRDILKRRNGKRDRKAGPDQLLLRSASGLSQHTTVRPMLVPMRLSLQNR